MSDKQKMKVLIIGAGSCGLLIAQGLKKAGIPFEVFERYGASESTRDWSMALHWGSEKLATCLSGDLLAKLASIQCDPHYAEDHGDIPAVRFCNGATGETLAAIPAKVMWRVSHRKTRSFMGQDIDIQYKKKLTSISTTSTSVTATFSDTTTVTGTLLVAADGAKSFVRNFLLGPDLGGLTSLSIVMFNFKASFKSEQAQFLRYGPGHHPISNFGIHPDQDAMVLVSILDVPDKNDASTWVFHLFFSSLTENNDAILAMSSQQRLHLLRERAQRFAEPWKSAFTWVPDGTEIPADTCMYWDRATKWDNRGGKVTLAGDAVHPIPPYRGQSFNNAIQDAGNYVEALKEISNGGDMQEIMDAYDDEVLERGKREAMVSVAQTEASHKLRVFMESPLVKLGVKPKNAD